MSHAPLLRTVRSKVLAGVLLSLVTALFVTGSALVLYELSNFRASLVNDLVGQAELLGRASAPALQFNDAQDAADNLALLAVRPRVRRAALYQANGRLFAEYRRDAAVRRPSPPMAGDEIEVFADRELILRRHLHSDGERIGTIEIEAEFPLRDRLIDYLGILLLVLLLALGIAVLVSFRLQTTITRPIEAMRDVARRVIQQRDYSLRAEKLSDDEIGYLVDAFNAMLEEVQSRTAELAAANHRLREEIHDRGAAEDEVRRLNESLEAKVALRTVQLEAANRELEAFSYSVSHDLRAPLRAIDGFSQAVLEDYGASLEPAARDHLDRVRRATQRMGQLIDDMLNLARVTRSELVRTPVDISAMLREIADELMRNEPERSMQWIIADDIKAEADARLLRIALQNLVSNAWKFTAYRNDARIEFGIAAPALNQQQTFFLKDNGVGFNMSHAHKLFAPFQRLHDVKQFPGTGIGLATTHRVIRKHGGLIWVQAAVGRGATFFFTLGANDDAQHANHTAD